MSSINQKNTSKALFKNTGIIAIGRISTKLVNFLLLPLYTALLSKEEYGTIDLLSTYTALIVVVVGLQMSEALFRFLVTSRDDEEKIKSVFSTVLFTTLGISLIYTVIFFVAYPFLNITGKWYLLLTAEMWRKLIPIKPLLSNYVLVYFNNPGKKSLKDAIQYAQKYGKKVVLVNYGFPVKGVINVKPKDLSEFLSYVGYADRVFSASYHGMLFSLYYNRPLTFYTRDHASRMLSLAKKLGIEDQCGDNIDIFSIPEINYVSINKNVEIFRSQSIDVLRDYLAM